MTKANKQQLKTIESRMKVIDKTIAVVKNQRAEYMNADKTYHCGDCKHVSFNTQIDQLTKEYNMLNKNVDMLLGLC